MRLPEDYEERVYAGVLGKIIGVYLGRPFENWTYERITSELGEIDYYVHDRLGQPLIVTDDDISGTFTFVRALEDAGCSRDLTPEQIGDAWLNYIIEGRTILWWGGLGNSTEHTAYLRLKRGVKAPRSGSMALNGRVVAEQIGAQIFIDGWAMVAPGDPEFAAELARRAASVSHDGEAVYAAQVLAAMEAAAFVEPDIDALLDVGMAQIPRESVIRQMIGDLRRWAREENDWRRARELLEAAYGYDKYGGNCHVVPNHGLIILALLYGGGDFQRSLKIVNTCGWDTDCNSGNLGCLLGIRGGLAAVDRGPDWRGPVGDRMYVVAADGARAITDAVIETYKLVNMGRTLAGLPPVRPKEGARFHFSLPGSVQGFRPEQSHETWHSVDVFNAAAPCGLFPDRAEGSRCLAIGFRGLAPGRVVRVGTPTFIPPDAGTMRSYALIASPTLYPGQRITARVGLSSEAGSALPYGGAVSCGLYVKAYGPDDEARLFRGPAVRVPNGEAVDLEFCIPGPDCTPCFEVGIELFPSVSPGDADDGGARSVPNAGVLYVDFLTWSGEPDVLFTRPRGAKGAMWRRAWVDATSRFAPREEPFRLMQDEGTGLFIQGAREWRDYRIDTTISVHMAEGAGVAARVQGMRRYYALLLRGGSDTNPREVVLVKAKDGEQTLARMPFPWEWYAEYALSLEAAGRRIRAWLDGRLIFDVTDRDDPLDSGAIALVCREGRMSAGDVRVRPAEILSVREWEK